MIDSGCEQNLIGSAFIQYMSIKAVPLTVPLCVSALDGKALPQITHKTKPLQLVISSNRSEQISFFIFPTANSSIILGFDWLQKHKPNVNWKEMHIESWSLNCHSTCLCSAVPPGPSPAVEQEADPPDLSLIPEDYHNIIQ